MKSTDMQVESKLLTINQPCGSLVLYVWCTVPRLKYVAILHVIYYNASDSSYKFQKLTILAIGHVLATHTSLKRSWIRNSIKLPRQSFQFERTIDSGFKQQKTVSALYVTHSFSEQKSDILQIA